MNNPKHWADGLFRCKPQYSNLTRGVLHDPGKAHAIPPGFIHLLKGESRIGVYPSESGGCVWVKLQPGQKGSTETIWGEIPDSERITHQREWLRATRAALGWQFIGEKIAVTQRTWEGWEGGRRVVPFFQAARIAFLTWEKTKAAGPGEHPAFAATPRRIRFRQTKTTD